LYIAAEAARQNLAIQRGKHGSRPIGRAGRDAFRFLLCTDREVKTEWLHRVLRLYKTLASRFRARKPGSQTSRSLKLALQNLIDRLDVD
jgi:hypothetical protein